VKGHDDPVCRGVNVGLEVAVPEFHRVTEGRHRVLRPVTSPAAVGEGQDAGVV